MAKIRSEINAPLERPTIQRRPEPLPLRSSHGRSCLAAYARRSSEG